MAVFSQSLLHGSEQNAGANPPSANPSALPVAKICRVLEATYHNPRHGNKSNPLDELIYIILSTRTRDETFRSTFRQLKRSYPSWNLIEPKDFKRLRAIIAPAGLGTLKARQIVSIIRRVRKNLGHATLAPLKRMSDEEAEAFLTSLPGVSAKVAKCVLMYALNRQVLPVDIHVHRVASRLGFVTKRRPDTSQDLIEQAVPPPLRYGFHVNAVAHGRKICVPRNPKCEICPVNRWCNYYLTRKA